jgi:hypothetical protein
VIAEPPFEGAVQLTVACPFPGVADTFDGAAGTVAAGVGVTEFDAADGDPVPTAFVAVTVNVYAVPFASPAIVTPVAGGEPVTVVGDCAAVPMYGVTV